jgi:hypothetical protein
MTNVLPPHHPHVLDIIRAHKKPLHIKLKPINHLDAYKLTEIPYDPSRKCNDRLSEGILAFWDDVELQIVGIRRIHENVVIFVAREATTAYTIDIWARTEWACVKPPPRHWMFGHYMPESIKIPSVIQKHR